MITAVIVDDHALVRQGTRHLLEASRDVVVLGEAADGEEAVSKVVALNPDVVLMDVGMPGMNGIEATARIKASCPRTAVLALTAHDDDAYVFALLEAGAAGYLLKSAGGDELIAAIRAIHGGESALSPSIARKVLNRFKGPRVGAPASDGVQDLTERELEVLKLAAHGLPNKGIAKEMVISPRTVQLHLAHIFKKLGVASRTEAVMTGLKRGWLRVDGNSG